MTSKAPARAIDVAKKAGVSRATVSRAFTKGSSISKTKLRKVLEAAETLGYHPNAIARTLSQGKSGIVGVVIADLTNPFYAKVLETVCLRLQEQSRASLVLSATDAGSLDAFLPLLMSYQVDGVIVAAATLTSVLADRCADNGLPVVQVNRYSEFEHVHVVVSDNIRGGQLAAEHLLGLGRKKLAFLAGRQDTSSSRDRELGFCGTLAQAGLRLAGRDVGDYSYHGALAAADRLLSQTEPPDGLFCANDLMAFAAIDVAHRRKLRVPQDVAIVGYDNTLTASSEAYNLTSVDQNIDQMVGQAVDIVLGNRAAPGGHAYKLSVACRLHIRGSSAGS